MKSKYEDCPLVKMGVDKLYKGQQPTITGVMIRDDVNLLDYVKKDGTVIPSREIIDACLNCPIKDRCVYDSPKDGKPIKKKRKVSPREEIVVQCRRCNTMETLYLQSNRLQKTSRFKRFGGDIYHVCCTEPVKVLTRCKVIDE